MPIEKELQEIISTASNIAKTLIARLKDGFQPLPDIMALFPSLMSVPAAIEGNEQAWAYLKDLTEEKTDEVIDSIMTEIKETSEDAKAIVKHSFLIAANGYMLFLAAKKIGDKNNPSVTAAP